MIIDTAYHKLRSIMTGHSIKKLCILAAVFAQVIIFMGLMMTTLKIQ